MIGEKLQFEKGPRGGKLLFLDGYNYRRSRKKGQNEVFNCLNYNLFSVKSGKKCRAQLQVYKNVLMDMTNFPHNHQPEPKKVVEKSGKTGKRLKFEENLDLRNEKLEKNQNEQNPEEAMVVDDTENGAENSFEEKDEQNDGKTGEEKTEGSVESQMESGAGNIGSNVQNESVQSFNLEKVEENSQNVENNPKDDVANDFVIVEKAGNLNEENLFENVPEVSTTAKARTPTPTPTSDDTTPEAARFTSMASEVHQTLTEVAVIQRTSFDNIFQETPKLPRS
uniref:FLYWCH-type domain-containing protein n=1 Tax=Panagrolaimus sp. JU765 TaxID=591449 RepID=A0AC34RQK5_9BILA